jgi:MoaA/NifB/PqqE/SkfB family radical SAM enzyme
MSWACHRRCPHCYDDRFRPYVRDDLSAVIGEGQAAYEAILGNLPDDMSYLDTDGSRKPTLLVLAGGEPLIDGFREELFYPLLEAVQRRWPDAPPRISVQTTGDIMKDHHIDEMLDRGVSTIAIASIDDHHVGHQGEGKFRLMDKVRAQMAARGVREVSLGGEKDDRLKPQADAKAAPAPSKDRGEGPTFLFFGAQPDLWIGELWPRGRAWANGLSEASYETNFCARWSGGQNFLHYGRAGSEVAIEPDGSVYPCCLKTKAPLGKLTEEPLYAILDDVAKEPAILALNDGDPEAMGLAHGWSREEFRRRAVKTDGKGRAVANVCLGCDAFFEERLGAILRERRTARLAKTDMVTASAARR